MKSSLSSIMSLSSMLLLTACGGGGGSDNNSGESPSPGTPSTIVTEIGMLDDSIMQNQSVELFILPPSANSNPTNIQWRQTSGPSLEILSATAKTISLLPQESASYTFEVSFSQQGQNYQLSKSFDVDSQAALVSIHSGHSVVEGNKVSLRAVIDNGVNEANISWQQTQGPAVTLEQGDSQTNLVLYFDAPMVTKDTIISFEATDSESGQSDVVAVLVENKPPVNPNDPYFDEPVATVFTYQSNSPYADDIVGCVYSNQLNSSCTLATLPLIAQETTSPTVDDIMNRVVVSHQWMGDRFKSFLENHDPHNDFKNLLRATTAVVLSYDVRPSFYWAATGAIYLDPENLWQTALERDTINEAPDYRSSFGNDLQFVMPWRYVNNNDYAYVRQSRANRTDRDIQDNLHRLTSLLYHELAHANDFFPPAEWQSHASSARILDAATATNWESDKLDATYPLSSQVMKNLADVSFRGNNASTTQRNYTPNDIASFFTGDNASDYYAYLTPREDLAMLFEELMMQSRYGIRRDVAVTNLPQGNNISITDYIVAWGQRGRIAEPNVSVRADYVTTRILPEFDVDTAINALPTPIAMTAGNDWLENLAISPAPMPVSTLKLGNQSLKIKQNTELSGAIETLPYGFKPLPKK
ncbi:hypothetical protein LP316_12885 [Thalassotalea sp. LPB0316]|uniref:hypothetical protein n=1 Tax=Thalassotalea sp. LPB0316 TaxID=2769490 RepID=UPI00186901EF|nr:hypothetical protein [Thalassotalea sp. LPB0316]QOL25185.1 hypothetical protein LP316_12885 [Thalassotalea sp. LPB0316]